MKEYLVKTKEWKLGSFSNIMERKYWKDKMDEVQKIKDMEYKINIYQVIYM